MYKKMADEEVIVGHLPIELRKLTGSCIDIKYNHEHIVVRKQIKFVLTNFNILFDRFLNKSHPSGGGFQ